MSKQDIQLRDRVILGLGANGAKGNHTVTLLVLPGEIQFSN